MGTVGINFGSATSGAGFDVATTVSAITANLTAIETPWKTQLTSLKAQDTALTTIGTDLSTLSTSLSALTDFQGILATKEGSSSDTNVVALASAGPTANSGSHTVVVTNLAQTSSEYSDPAAATDTLSGSLALQVGAGAATTVPIVAGQSDTLSTYAAAINAAGLGISASVISDTSGSRLSLVSQTGGSAGQLTVTGTLTDSTTSTSLTLNTGLLGRDANLTVDGTAVVSGSNTISTAIPGRHLPAALRRPLHPGSARHRQRQHRRGIRFPPPSSLPSTPSSKTSPPRKATTPRAMPSPLYGQSIISQLQSSLSLSLTSGAASGSISSLSQLGISVNNDGTLALDTSTLDSTLNSSYSDVVGFLQNTGSFGQNLNATLLQVGSASPTGAITTQLASYTSQEATLNIDVTNQNTLIATDTASLTTELNTANEALQEIPQQLDEVNELYSSLTGYNESSDS